MIAFRNEEKHLPALLQSLIDQEYNPTLLEIILVNDHSTDLGFSLAQSIIEKNGLGNFLLINVLENKSGINLKLQTNHVY